MSNCEQCGTPLRTYKLTAYSCPQEDPGDPRRDGNEHTVTRCRDVLKARATTTITAAARLCKAINDDDANGINDETLKAVVDLRLLLSPSGAVNHLVDQSIPAPTNADVAMSDLRAMSDLMAEVDRLRAVLAATAEVPCYGQLRTKLRCFPNDMCSSCRARAALSLSETKSRAW